MILSRMSEYGLRALIYLTSVHEQNPKAWVPIKEIANHLEIPRPFLAKILQQLARFGILESQKGPGGGFRLATESKRIRLWDVVQMLDGYAFVDTCILGFKECSDEQWCPLHNHWKPLRERIIEMLENMSLEDLAKESQLRGLEILSREVGGLSSS